jgi:hypothetical protein
MKKVILSATLTAAFLLGQSQPVHEKTTTIESEKTRGEQTTINSQTTTTATDANGNTKTYTTTTKTKADRNTGKVKSRKSHTTGETTKPATTEER